MDWLDEVLDLYCHARLENVGVCPPVLNGFVHFWILISDSLEMVHRVSLGSNVMSA